MIPSSYSRWISGLTLVDDADAANLAFFLSGSEADADAAPVEDSAEAAAGDADETANKE